MEGSNLLSRIHLTLLRTDTRLYNLDSRRLDTLDKALHTVAAHRLVVGTVFQTFEMLETVAGITEAVLGVIKSALLDRFGRSFVQGDTATEECIDTGSWAVAVL